MTKSCPYKTCGGCGCSLGGLCIPQPNTNCPDDWFINSDIFDDVKFGDKFVARSGLPAIYLGRKGELYVLAYKANRTDDYVILEVNFCGLLRWGEPSSYDIVSRWGEDVKSLIEDENSEH